MKAAQQGVPVRLGPDRSWVRNVFGGGLLVGGAVYLLQGRGMAAVWAVLAVVLCVLRWRSQTRTHMREDRVDRLRKALARATRTELDGPHAMVVRPLRGAWKDGSPLPFMARVSPYADLADPVRDAARRVEVVGLVAGMCAGPVEADWTNIGAGRVVFRRATGTAPLPEPGTDDAVEAVATSLRAFTRGDVDVRVVDSDEQGPARLRVAYPTAAADEDPDWRLKFAAKVNAKTVGRWRAEHWDTERSTVTLVRRPPMPSLVPHPAPTEKDSRRLPFALGEHGETVCWDLDVAPHLLIVGSTGGGKTVTISTLLTEAAWRGHDIALIDPKGTALAGFQRWPGVVRSAFADPAEMSETMLWAERLVDARYREVREHHRDARTFPPVLVVLDEAAEYTRRIDRWWSDQGKKGSAPAAEAWRSVARLGREANVHLVLGIQQANAKYLDGTEARDNFGGRVACGPVSQQGAVMAFGSSDVGRDLPKEAKGRMTVDLGGEVAEVQGWWTPWPLPDGSIRPEDADILEALRPDRPTAAAAATAEAAPPAVAPARAAAPTRTAARPKRATPRAVYKAVGDLVVSDTILLRGERVTVTALDPATYGEDGGDPTEWGDVTVRDSDGVECVETLRYDEKVRLA